MSIIRIELWNGCGVRGGTSHAYSAVPKSKELLDFPTISRGGGGELVVPLVGNFSPGVIKSKYRDDRIWSAIYSLKIHIKIIFSLSLNIDKWTASQKSQKILSPLAAAVGNVSTFWNGCSLRKQGGRKGGRVRENFL